MAQFLLWRLSESCHFHFIIRNWQLSKCCFSDTNKLFVTVSNLRHGNMTPHSRQQTRYLVHYIAGNFWSIQPNVWPTEVKLQIPQQGGSGYGHLQMAVNATAQFLPRILIYLCQDGTNTSTCLDICWRITIFSRINELHLILQWPLGNLWYKRQRISLVNLLETHHLNITDFGLIQEADIFTWDTVQTKRQAATH